MNNSLIIIAGATAVGKTDLSVSLAKKINGEIISADSMQVYKGMDVGTAKITAEEMDGVPHYLIDEYDPADEFNVYEFKNQAKKYINEIQSRDKVPILVGGTGFYIQAVLYNIDFTEEEDDSDFRKNYEEILEKDGPEVLHGMLKAVDPAAAEEIHPNNTKRVIRALVFHQITGGKISEHNQEQRQKTSPYNYAYFVLNRERDVIYDRINQRVDLMVERGLLSEVQGLLDKGYSPDLVSMQGLGYKEVALYLNGQISLEESIDRIKQGTRHFAKRQITWFKREKDAIWCNYEDFSSKEELLEHMLLTLKEKEIV